MTDREDTQGDSQMDGHDKTGQHCQDVTCPALQTKQGRIGQLQQTRAEEQADTTRQPKTDIRDSADMTFTTTTHIQTG